MSRSLWMLFVLVIVPSMAWGDIYHCRIDGKDWFLNYPCPKKSKKLGVVMKTPGATAPLPAPAETGGGGPTVASLPNPAWASGPASSPSWTPPAAGSKRMSGERTEIDRIIQEASRTYNIPEPFIRAVIEVESNYGTRALSYKGAMGLMQLMPSVCKDLGVTDPWDPYQNIMAGAHLLRILANRFQGDIPSVIAAYHAGGGSVATREGIPYQGTDGYVRKVLDHYYRLKNTAQAPTAGVGPVSGASSGGVGQ